MRRMAILFLLLTALGFPQTVQAQGQLINGSRTLVGTLNYCLDTGAANAYACNLAPALPAYLPGAFYSFKALHANTTASTLALNGLATLALTKINGGIGTALTANDICVGQLVVVFYDGTRAQIVSPLCTNATLPAGSATELQYRASATTFGALGGSSVSGSTVTLTSPAIANIVPGADFTLTQNSVVPFTSIAAGALVNTLVLKAGWAGFGTNAPGAKVHVLETSGVGVQAKIEDNNGGQAGLVLAAGKAGTNRATRIDVFNNNASTTVPRWILLNDYNQNGTNDLSLLNAAGTYSVLTILQNGNIGFNQTNPTFLLESAGTVRHASLTAAVATNNTLCIIAGTKEVVENAASSCLVSSIRFKDHVLALGDATSSLLAFRPVSYTLKGTAAVRLGLIAEEVYVIEPRLVDLDENNLPHSVRYAEMVSLVIKGMQELEARIALLEKR